jgi:hypothetical protein
MGSGTRLCSDVFEAGGQLFRIEVCERPSAAREPGSNQAQPAVLMPGPVRNRTCVPVQVYPAGVTRDHARYLGLFLTTPGSTRPSHLLYQLGVVDR